MWSLQAYCELRETAVRLWNGGVCLACEARAYLAEVFESAFSVKHSSDPRCVAIQASLLSAEVSNRHSRSSICRIRGVAIQAVSTTWCLGGSRSSSDERWTPVVGRPRQVECEASASHLHRRIKRRGTRPPRRSVAFGRCLDGSVVKQLRRSSRTVRKT